MTIQISTPQTVTFPRLDDPREFERIRSETEQLLRSERVRRASRRRGKLVIRTTSTKRA